MNKPKWFIIAWLLLLVPTLLLGVGALRLLQGEQARLVDSSRLAAADRVQAIAGNIDLAIDEVQDGLLDTLRSLPQPNLFEQLNDWKRTNPLVRNVFIWQSGHGLLLPDPEQPAGEEEAAFVRRYLPLFSEQSDWVQVKPADQPQAPQPAKSRRVLLERKELRQLAKQAPSAEMAYSEGAPTPASAADRASTGQSHWRSWYADDQLHLLGWFAPADEDLRYGLEIEMMGLLSRLLANLPHQAPDGESFALLDGNGHIFHQIGPFEVNPKLRPLAAVPIGNLPHWQVAAYRDPQAADSGSGIWLIGTLLIGTFSLAILLGGSLLLWQAWRNQRDARQKTSFVSNVSHELKTPLTTIRMYAELLGEGTIREAQKQQSYLQTIIKESRRLTRLVNNILDFSRLEQGRRSYRKERFSLHELIRDIVEQQQPRLTEAGLELVQEMQSDEILMESDRDALEQILLNLLDNALKYASEGKRLSLRLKTDKRAICLQLRDFGPGIPAAHRQRIFEKFHRVDNSLTSRQQGSGLGLSIARQLAEGLGGSLTYCPAESGGSCFELRLPPQGG